MMRLKSGKHEGKTTGELLIKVPDWAQWMLANYPDSPVSKSLRDLEERFDARPFEVECATCHEPAALATAYQGIGFNLMFWCDDCDPYGSGARSGTLTRIRTVAEALRHVDMTCDGSQRTQKREIIKELAQAKGLSGRLTEARLTQFFGL
jgi:hypothetical protein